jgi:hypothetical protein
MDLIPSFVARKHGREVVEYPHPLVEPVLSETYGIMVYQEQVMQTAQVLGGYSLGGADLLRRAMGKKKAEEMAQHREIFREGAAKNNIGADKADEIFDLMEKFAGYGFNKSHAAAYSLLAYHTAWLKVHYTAEFYCANMTIEMDNTDKLKVLFEDATKNFGITFEAPDVNRGTWRFEPISDKVVRYGLGAIKGTGQSAIEAIVAAREEGGAFQSLYDFCCRVDRGRINKRTVEALIKAGAFDALHMNRAALVASIDRAFEFAATSEANANQGGLFDMGDSHAASHKEPELLEALPWGVKERLSHEKTALGFYLSGHLFDEVEREVRRFCKRRIEELVDTREPLLLAGIVTDMRIINGQRGRLALFKLDDKTDVIDAAADEAVFNPHRGLVQGRRAGGGDGEAATRPLFGRLPPERAADLGPGDGALPVRQVPEGRGERDGARHPAPAARVPAQAGNVGAGGAGARAGRAAAGAARQRGRRTAARRAGAVLSHRCRPGQLDGAGPCGPGADRLRELRNAGNGGGALRLPGGAGIRAGCPSTSDRRGATMRAVRSAMPPGARPTASRRGLIG